MDYTMLRIAVSARTDGDNETVGRLITAHDPSAELTEDGAGVRCVIEDARIGRFREDIAPGLISAVPECRFTGWEEPADGHPGALTAYDPEWGLLEARCDADGRVILTFDEAAALLGRAVPPVLEAGFGLPWETAREGTPVSGNRRGAWHRALDAACRADPVPRAAQENGAGTGTPGAWRAHRPPAPRRR